MLVIQLVQDRGSQLHFGLSSLYLSCEIQLWVLVVFLHHSELHRVAFQDDWIASRMKNSAKMHLHLFTQTNENIRTNTQYRCHFRRRMFNVVGYYSVCSTTSAPPPLTFFNFRMFFLSLPFLPFRGVCAAFSHSQVRSTRVCLSSFHLSFHKSSNVFSFPHCDVYAFFE